MPKTVRIAVLVSGGGTNLQALLDAQKMGKLSSGEIVLVVSSSPKAFALERAKKSGVSTIVVSRKESGSSQAFDKELVKQLKANDIQMVVLAGFLCILGKDVIDAYRDRIINVHPSLIPSFCGAGFYGLKVHEAALEYGVKVTGATVHLVNEIPDGGKILLQKAVDILPGDTAEILQKRVMEQAEWDILPRATAILAKMLS